jgi:hypothetical protein
MEDVMSEHAQISASRLPVEEAVVTRRQLTQGAGVLLAVPVMMAASGCTTASALSPTDSPRATDLKLAMRKLWEDHITYTRNFIISALAGLPDQPAVTQRLLGNQDDIGNAVKPYYGDAAGTQLSRLLRDHILIAADVVTAAKAGNSSQLTAKQREWSDNGRQIAAFLSGANPAWERGRLESMLQRHLDLTTGEVVGRLGRDWAADIRSYDQGHVHMLMFADVLADGIVRQFPDRFA